nr:MAG TPA: hypothetical protein [Caudoviricetes sp.]
MAITSRVNLLNQQAETSRTTICHRTTHWHTS